jgi:predicted RNase H-like HicB family nuclease
MIYSINLSSGDGEYLAECPDMGLSSRGLSPTNALDNLRAAIRYQIELCPCSTVQEEDIELDVRGL